jgi:hypothetical protein
MTNQEQNSTDVSVFFGLEQLLEKFCLLLLLLIVLSVMMIIRRALVAFSFYRSHFGLIFV